MKILMLRCRRLKDTVHIAQTIAATIGTESASPFEFRVLEALLAETAHHFEGKSRQELHRIRNIYKLINIYIYIN